MKAPIIRDKAKRPIVYKTQEQKTYLKSLKTNARFFLSTECKKKLETFLIKIPKNRCIVTGRGRAVLSDFKLSRLEFYRNISKLPGLKKGKR